MKTILNSILCLIALSTVIGCASIESALLTKRPVEQVTVSQVPVVTPVTNLVESVPGAPPVEVITLRTNYVQTVQTNTVFVYEPKAEAQAITGVVSTIPTPWTEIGGGLLTILLSLYAAIKNRNISVALVKSIEAGRLAMQLIPEGKGTLAKEVFDAALQNQQTASGQKPSIEKLVNTHTVSQPSK